MRHNFEFWLLLVTCALALPWVAFALGDLSVSIAQAEPQATATPVNPCAEWGQAGAQIIFKCIDDDPPWATCYVPVGGVMQCLKE